MIRLLGPHPFDPLAPARSARPVLAALANGNADLGVGDGSAPGLYLILDEDDALRGFWVTLSETWLDEGMVAGVTPPFAKGLLDAATEELWWARLRVAPMLLNAWRPLVVIEWPPDLANRCALPPPGVPPGKPRQASEGWGDELPPQWLELDDAGPPTDSGATNERPWANLPPARSLLCIIRGSLRWSRSVHQGRFELVVLGDPDEAGLGVGSMPASWRSGIPVEDWLELAAGQPDTRDADHRLGHPIRLPGGRTGFPLSGWLSRDLEIQPPRPMDAVVGQLVPRDTRSPLVAQALTAGMVTILLLLGTLGFSGGLQWLSAPVVQDAAPAIEPAAQPAFSVCSAVHGRFVDQLSCQVAHLAAGAPDVRRDCASWRHDTDLQAAWCGLRDRDQDQWFSPSGHPWADTAAAQACFDVLGQPWEYALGGLGDITANPTKLLDDARLSVNALVEVVANLDAGCNAHRDKLTALVDGAVLATHVGDGSGEAGDLQQLAFDVASRGAGDTASRCMDRGRTHGVQSATTWAGLCRADAVQVEKNTVDGWSALAGDPPEDRVALVDRYTDARFAAGRRAEDPRWACHMGLATATRGGTAKGRWDLSVPVPRTYASSGVRSQLELDAWLLALREDGIDADDCWQEVDRMLASYVPVHPLVGPLAPDGWPSEEQQVCGQVCAVAYGFERGASTWRTRGTDLSLCLDDSAPPLDEDADIGLGTLDRLRMPWNDAARQRTWVPPKADEICAFNLVAQGYLPSALPPDMPPPVWAGEVVTGSRIAGGVSGAASRAAMSLVQYGLNRSTATCGYVATQCFTHELLAITGDPKNGAHLWSAQWRTRLRDLALASADDLADRPWCRIIRPFLSTDGRLPEGELDFPCALGVDEARSRLDTALTQLVTSTFSPTTVAP